MRFLAERVKPSLVAKGQNLKVSFSQEFFFKLRIKEYFVKIFYNRGLESANV